MEGNRQQGGGRRGKEGRLMMSPGQKSDSDHVRMEEETRHACSRGDEVRNYGKIFYLSLPPWQISESGRAGELSRKA